MAVGKYLLATRDLKRAYCTNLPENWTLGFPSDNGNNDTGTTPPVDTPTTPELIEINIGNNKLIQGQNLILNFNNVSSISANDGCGLFDNNKKALNTGYFESSSKAIIDTSDLEEGTYSVFLSASQWDESSWSNKPKNPRSNIFELTVEKPEIIEINVENKTINKGQNLILEFNNLLSINANDGCCLFNKDKISLCTGYFESSSKAIIDTSELNNGTYEVYLSASVWDEASWSNKPKNPRSNIFVLNVS